MSAAAAAAAAVVVVVCSMASCEPTSSTTTDVDAVPSSTVYVEHRPVCLDAVVTVESGSAVPCDVVPPSVLDVHYDAAADYDAVVLDCQSMGGTPPPPPPPLDVDGVVCHAVDY